MAIRQVLPAAMREAIFRDGTKISYMTVGAGPSIVAIPGVMSGPISTTTHRVSSIMESGIDAGNVSQPAWWNRQSISRWLSDSSRNSSDARCSTVSCYHDFSDGSRMSEHARSGYPGTGYPTILNRSS
jgi:hypothetical protein